MIAGNVFKQFYDEWDWFGMTSHVGGIRLSHLKVAERMAEAAGDDEFAARCREWYAQGSEAMETKMWTGEYYLLDQAVHTLKPKHRQALGRAHIGFVFQSYHLLDDLTVEENLEVPLSYRNVRRTYEVVAALSLDISTQQVAARLAIEAAARGDGDGSRS